MKVIDIDRLKYDLHYTAPEDWAFKINMQHIMKLTFCEECKYWENVGLDCGICKCDGLPMCGSETQSDWFCGSAEEKENDRN